MPLVEGCSIPDAPAELMQKPGPLPLLQDFANDKKGKVKQTKVDTPKLLKGYGLMTEAAVDRHNTLVALQAHIRDIRAIKRRCAAPGSTVVAARPPSTN